MSDMKITLPGSETVTLTGQTIDKLIRAGDGDAALLYLYILKTHGRSTSSQAAVALDKGKGWIASAMAMLSRLGLVELDDSEEVSEKNINEPRKYTEDEVKNEIIKGSNFAVVVDETQRRLGKILSPDELLRLFGIYDNLRLPPEVILQLITHCINESQITGDGRAPSVRYIEKAAYTWEREGVFTLERAEEYLKALESKKSIRGKIRTALQIQDRQFSATEKSYVDGWIAMGIEPEAIAIAYDRTVTKTGKLTWAYMDSIIKNWHSKGLHTAQQVLEKDGSFKKSAARTGANLSGQKRGEPNQKEMERMTRILNKVKEE
jgi:DnaD/phage-associated family protein